MEPKEPKVEIQEYLDKKDKTFQEGLDILTKYSHNRAMILQVGRKQKQDLLEYQLQKLLTLPLKPFAVKITGDISRNVSKGLLEDRDQETKFRQFETIDKAKLPKNLQKVHDELAEAYKLQRTYHEKMKLAETDEARGELRAEVMKCDDIIANGWKGIDKFIKEGIPVPPKAKVKAKNVLQVSKEINAARSYISRSINDIPKLEGKKLDERKEKVLDYINKLIELKIPVKKETRAALVKLAIIDEKSNLVGE